MDVIKIKTTSRVREILLNCSNKGHTYDMSTAPHSSNEFRIMQVLIMSSLVCRKNTSAITYHTTNTGDEFLRSLIMSDQI